VTDNRSLLIADQLLLIERELRYMALWTDEAPSEAAMASVEPFCVDTMDFSQWLQWIFLPRMKSIIEQGAALPETSGIRSMAEVVYSETSEARPLLDALGRFDQIISGGN
jgi:uncharacterized protein YqcC (DUF446 family)